MPPCFRPSSTLRRWIVFNIVGATGIAVQLAALATLHRVGFHYLAATTLGVEAAILNNFVWHERWTWLDRTRHGPGGAIARLLRFNFTVGAVSIAQNLVFMKLLVGYLGIHYLVANIASITACSLINFLLSDRIVFRTRFREAPAMNDARKRIVVLSGALLLAAASGSPAEAQKAETLTGWREYVTRTEERIARELNGADGFFVSEFEEPGPRPDERDVLGRGDLVIEKMKTLRPDGNDIPVSDGLIHHWRGAVFLPGVRLEEVLEAVRHPELDTHQKDVLEARVLERNEDLVRVYLKLVRSKIVTATYNTEHIAYYRPHGMDRVSSRTVATKIAELDAAGTPDEREKPVGEDRGFLWRLHSYWRYGAVEGGVIVECESLSLSRSIPLLARPFVGPIVNGVARESLARTLEALRMRLLGSGLGGSR